MRNWLIPGLLAALIAPLHASTLLQLSLDDMIRKSTSIVRGKAQRTYSGFHGSMIYTHYQIQVSENLKGPARTGVELMVPGGISNGVQQNYAGAPALVDGQDYVIFLWTSASGVTQVIGLSQGLFVVSPDASGNPMVMRAASSERMLNGSGQPVADSDIRMSLSDLRARIQQVLSGKVGP